MNNKSLKRRISSWFTLAVLILTVIGALVALSFYQFKEQQRWVEHTYEVIGKIQSLVSSIEAIQSSQRGYVITGLEEYLAPYTISLQKIEEDLAALDLLIMDNGKQKARFDRLKSQLAARTQFAGNVIAAYKEKGEQAGFALVRTGTGKREMDEIRETASTMIAEEQHLLSARRLATSRAIDIAMGTGGFGLLVCTAILIFVFWLVQREMLRRAKTEEDLHASLSQMEQISKESELLTKLGDFLQSCQTVEEAFIVLQRHIPALLPETKGLIALLNNSQTILHSQAKWGAESESFEDFEPDQCWSLRRGATHHADPTGTNPPCAHVKAIGAGGSICVPMLAHGETIGMFFVEGETDASLQPRKQNIIKTLSEQTSLAIANLRLQDKLRQQSMRDPLTQLFNRRYLQETLEREISRARRNKQEMCCLVIDIDHFKKFNDTYGHDGGDALLVNFAKLLSQNVRNEDIVCRYGGEEFVVILPGTNAEGGMARANILRTLASEMTVVIDKKTVANITFSAGMSVFPQHGDTMEDLITLADSALYKAKNQGRNQVVLFNKA